MTFLDRLPDYWESLRAELYEKVGNPKTDAPLLTAFSPALHVDKIKAALLVSHGDKDIRVNIDQSRDVVTGLQSRGLKPEYVPFSNEGHIFESRASINFHNKAAAFLEQYLHPDKP